MSGAISPSDRTFLRHFSLMIASLAIMALLLVALSAWIYGSAEDYADPLETMGASARIAPVGAVYSGDTGRAAMAAAQAAAAKAAEGQVAYGGTTDGKEVYDHLCHSCHTAGVAGAPKVGNKADWAPRIAAGMDTLIKHAIDGYTGPDGNVMPPKGGNPALTDEQVGNTVKWIVAQVQ